VLRFEPRDSQWLTLWFDKEPAVETGNGRVELEHLKQAMPRGGRPLVMAKRVPTLCNTLTAFCARLIKIFCSVTSVIVSAAL
jgi:hypothetical protein